MSVSPSPPKAGAEAAPAALHQVYVTHCLQADSVRHHAGMSVRASSTTDPELLEFAFQYPAYELPLDMWSGEPTPAQAPRRLALVPGPKGLSALVHSAYVEKDTEGRKGNFFSHVVYGKGVSLAAAVQTWGSREWVTGYPQGASKQLRPLAALPRREALQDAVLTGFLAGSAAWRDQSLATLLCPARLPEAAAARQDLLARAMQACLLALREGPQGARGRCYILAEPGLVALLLYGVARLLPGGQVERLTFSTYETMHRSLRQFRLAQVVGTYAKDPGKGLDSEFVTSRGFALDTFDPRRSSPELQGEVPAELAELVGLAARGAWPELAERQQFHSADAVSAPSLRAAKKAYDFHHRLKEGRLAPADLMELRATPEGRAVVERQEERLWPFILAHSLTDAQVRDGFADTVRRRAGEVKAAAAKVLTAAGWPKWQQYWGLLKSVRGADRAALSADLADMLQAALGSDATKQDIPRLRLALLAEWQKLQGPNDKLPAPVEGLLAVHTAAEFEQLFAQPLPPAWRVAALKHALVRPATVAAAVLALRKGDVELLRGFCRDALPDLSEEQQGQMLSMFLGHDPAEGRPLFERLLRAGPRLRPDVTVSLVRSLDGDGWGAFWTEGEHLHELLATAADHPGEAGKLWDLFWKSIDSKVVLGSKTQRKLLTLLEEARRAAKAGPPFECAEALDDWRLLVDVFESDGEEGRPGQQELETVCKRRCNASGVDLLRTYFNLNLQDRPDGDPELQRFTGTVRAFCLPGTHYQSHLAALETWAKVVQDCRDAERRKAGLPLLFLRLQAPAEHRVALARDGVQKGIVSRRVLQVLQAEAPAAAEAPAPAPPKAAPQKAAPAAPQQGGGQGIDWRRHGERALEIARRPVVLACVAGLLFLVVLVQGCQVSSLRGELDAKSQAADDLKGELDAKERRARAEGGLQSQQIRDLTDDKARLTGEVKRLKGDLQGYEAAAATLAVGLKDFRAALLKEPVGAPESLLNRLAVPLKKLDADLSDSRAAAKHLDGFRAEVEAMRKGLMGVPDSWGGQESLVLADLAAQAAKDPAVMKEPGKNELYQAAKDRALADLVLVRSEYLESKLKDGEHKRLKDEVEAWLKSTDPRQARYRAYARERLVRFLVDVRLNDDKDGEKRKALVKDLKQ